MVYSYIYDLNIQVIVIHSDSSLKRPLSKPLGQLSSFWKEHNLYSNLKIEIALLCSLWETWGQSRKFSKSYPGARVSEIQKAVQPGWNVSSFIFINFITVFSDNFELYIIEHWIILPRMNTQKKDVTRGRKLRVTKAHCAMKSDFSRNT